jgi:hypothetical protein
MQAFKRMLKEAKDWLPMRLLASSSMPKHWRLVLWPFADGTLPRGYAG